MTYRWPKLTTISSQHGYLLQAQLELDASVTQFEQAISRCPDHPSAIVGLCNILLDTSAPLVTSRPTPPSVSYTSHHESVISRSPATRAGSSPLQDTQVGHQDPAATFGSIPGNPACTSPNGPTHANPSDPTLELDRLAARDRAYGLLVSLVDTSAGWDYSDAWLALARLHELSGETEKARQELWRCVELEDHRPVRHWRNAASRGFIL